MSKPLLQVLAHQTITPPPIWFMRQAGRYLPEYRALRADTGTFLDCCYTTDVAAQITLQPLKRFAFDAAIIFSDILVVPHALGLSLSFKENHGPVLQQVVNQVDLEALHFDETILRPVYEAIHLVKAQLTEKQTLIGFIGAPWTICAYMLEGKSSQRYLSAKTWAKTHPAYMAQLLEIVEQALASHAINQIEAGCEVIQIFDSWAGVLSGAELMDWSIASIARIVSKIRHTYPKIPIIVFPRGVNEHYPTYAKELASINALGVDYDMDVSNLVDKIDLPLQGNLHPQLLCDDLPAALRATERLLDVMKGHPFIFNLGHGILPQTPISHVEAIIQKVKQVKS